MTCPKCKGFVLNDCGDWRCMNCGWRALMPFVPVPVKETRNCWDSSRCEMCGLPALTHKRVCRGCARLETEIMRRVRGRR